MKINSENNKGFTIIEIIVVIGIIAVLTAVILPSLNNIRAKNRDTEKIGDIATLQLGLGRYYSATTTGGYPKNLQALVDDGYVPADALISPSNPYIYVPLTRDTGKNPKCTSYHLGVTLESGSAQVDIQDAFSTLKNGSGQPANANGYKYCGTYGNAPGEEGLTSSHEDNLAYEVHP